MSVCFTDFYFSVINLQHSRQHNAISGVCVCGETIYSNLQNESGTKRGKKKTQRVMAEYQIQIIHVPVTHLVV